MLRTGTPIFLKTRPDMQEEKFLFLFRPANPLPAGGIG